MPRPIFTTQTKLEYPRGGVKRTKNEYHYQCDNGLSASEIASDQSPRLPREEEEEEDGLFTINR
jgi:hypothetical protein